MTNVLSLLVVVPLAGLVPLFLFRRDERAAKQVAITTTLVELVVSLWMLAEFIPGDPGFQLVERVDWLPSLGIRYLVGVDGISVLLVPMTTLLTFISVLYSSGGAIKTRIVEPRRAPFYLKDWLNYSAIVLMNVPAIDLVTCHLPSHK